MLNLTGRFQQSIPSYASALCCSMIRAGHSMAGHDLSLIVSYLMRWRSVDSRGSSTLVLTIRKL